MTGPREVRFRLPGSAYLVVAFVFVCVTPMVQHPWAAVIYIVPVAALAYVVRTATIARADTITARAVFGSRTLPWSELAGFSTDDRGRVYAAVRDGRVVRLPCVRARHLDLLAQISGNRLETVGRPEPPAS